MRSIILIMFILITNSASANCLVELETQGLSTSQEAQVKNILKSKNYRINNKTRGDHDLRIEMGTVENCIPGFDAVFNKISFYRVESATMNIFSYKTKSVSRLSGSKVLFSSLKTTMNKLKNCIE